MLLGSRLDDRFGRGTRVAPRKRQSSSATPLALRPATSSALGLSIGTSGACENPLRFASADVRIHRPLRRLRLARSPVDSALDVPRCEVLIYFPASFLARFGERARVRANHGQRVQRR
jgi:hypothetical protein